MKYYLYEIRNIINNNIYIGAHCSNKKNDYYWGSGVELRKAIKKFGKNNFKKTIIEYFDNHIDCFNKERDIVNEEFINRPDTYNKIVGGGGLSNVGKNNKNKVLVIDNTGNIFYINKNDKKYTSGKLKHFLKDKITTKDNLGVIHKVYKDDLRIQSGILTPIRNYTNVKNNKNKKRRIKKTLNENQLILVEDNTGNRFTIKRSDSRFINGDVKFISIIYTNSFKDNIPKENVLKLYKNDKISINKISEIYKCSCQTIRRIIKSSNY